MMASAFWRMEARHASSSLCKTGRPSIGNGSSSYSGECDTAKIVRREALHLAQLAWDGKTVDPPADLAWRFGRDETSDWFNWIAWQQSYKAWRDYGLNDQDARYYVGGLTHLLSEDGKRLVEKALQAA